MSIDVPLFERKKVKIIDIYNNFAMANNKEHTCREMIKYAKLSIVMACE